jgi:hypothetical protein
MDVGKLCCLKERVCFGSCWEEKQIVRITPIIEIRFIVSELLFESTKHASKNQSCTRDDHHVG